MGRAPCCEKNGLKKGPWTSEEDQKLIDYIQKHGCGNWRTLPKNAGLQRCGKSCRLRWTNYLRPDIKRGRFSFEEEETIIQLHSILGNKWSAIAARLPGRTDNEIKNYWNTHIRKRLLRMGIDPVTHSPRLDLLDFSSILNSSLYNSSPQMNLSRLLGMQTLANPELLKLATSLLSSQHENPYILQQNDQMSPLVQSSHFQAPVQDIQNCTTLSVPFSGDTQLMQPIVEQLSSNITNFSTQDCQVNEWQGNGMPTNSMECYVPVQDHYMYQGSDQFIMDPPPSETSTFQSNNSNNLRFQSVLSNLSTPSSSPAPVNSNSTYVTSSSNEDERESYCSNMFKVEIPHILDVKRESYCSNMFKVEIPHILDVNEFM